MRIADSYIEELTMEASTTRRVLVRVPEASMGWTPHTKSMSLGQLFASFRFACDQTASSGLSSGA